MRSPTLQAGGIVTSDQNTQRKQTCGNQALVTMADTQTPQVKGAIKMKESEQLI